MEVSQRTIYRDIQQLMMSGVPINGEAGTGYWLEKGFDFPPLMFTEEETEALMLGMRLATQTADQQTSNRTLRALELTFWGKVWTLTAWCEKRKDFRSFRVDRIKAVKVDNKFFEAESGKTLTDYYQRQMERGFVSEGIRWD